MNPPLLPLLFCTIAPCAWSASAQDTPTPSDPGYMLSADTIEVLAEYPGVREELDAVLRDLFGTPSRPAFRRLEKWSALGFDPNVSPFRGLRPDVETADDRLDALRVENRGYWAGVLELIEAGEADEIVEFPAREELTASWHALLESRAGLGEDAFGERVDSLFVEHYPELAESARLFELYCSRCHGEQGHGNGPMADRFFPMPRDYRKGIFKFAAVEAGSKPRRTDLLRTVIHGLPGSVMPSFRAIPRADIEGLVDYVRLLALRGETEAILVAEWAERDNLPREAALETYTLLWDRWLRADQRGLKVTAPPPDPDPARWKLGRAVFLDKERGNCFRCHGTEGRGNGPNAVEFDEDGGEIIVTRDEWGHPIRPRDFTEGVFRRGSEREDIYTRLFCGIPGTPMPALGPGMQEDEDPLLTDEEAWALVDYVLSLSGQGPLAGSVR